MRPAFLIAFLALLPACAGKSLPGSEGGPGSSSSSGGSSTSGASSSGASSSSGGASSGGDPSFAGTIPSVYRPGDEVFLVDTGTTSSSSGSSGTGDPGVDHGGALFSLGAKDPSDVAEQDAGGAQAVSADGKTLYTLDAYRGFQVFDLSSLDAPILAARLPVPGRPVDLRLAGTTAVLTLTDTVAWSRTADGGAAERVGSQVWTVDVSTPAAPRVLSRIDLSGELVESRVVGDSLYALSRGLAQDRRYVAWLSGVHLADPAAVTTVVELGPGAATIAELGDERITVASSGASGELATVFRVYELGAAGALKPGAVFKTSGLIQNLRWMHHDAGRGVFAAVMFDPAKDGSPFLVGVLRLWSSPTPAAVSPAGELATGPYLDDVRFDGTRAYLLVPDGAPLGVHQLVVADLSDPAHPLLSPQALVLPGPIVSVEARGDRVLAVGHSGLLDPPQTWLYLVDVAARQGPRLLSSVAVGDRSAVSKDLPGNDPARALQVLDGGLIAVPAYTHVDAWPSTATHVALAAFTPDAIASVARLAIPDRVGRVAALPGRPGQLALVSATAVATVDATAPAAPRIRKTLDLSQPFSDIVLVGGKAAVLAGSPESAQLRVLDPLTPDAAPLATLALPGAWRLHAAGSTVWALHGRGVAAVDLSDPAHPRVRSSLDVVAASWASGGTWGCPVEVRFTGSTLLVHRDWAGGCGHGYDESSTHDLLVVDLSSPDAPRFAARVPLRGRGHAGIVTAGAFAWLMHSAPSDSRPGWVGAYADRLNLSDPAHPTLLSVNVPGDVVGASADGSRLYALGGAQWIVAPQTQAVQTELHALDLTDHGTARLAATAIVPGLSAGVAFADTRAYLGTSGRLSTIELATMRVGSTQPAPVMSPLRLVAGKLVVGTRSPSAKAASMPPEGGYGRWVEGALVFGLADPDRPAFERGLQTHGWLDLGAPLAVGGAAAHLASGAWGLASLELGP
jgi:hypothetical protein